MYEVLSLMSLNNRPFKVHPAGWPFVIIAALFVVALALFSGVAFLLGLVVFAWVVYFFRDPRRITPVREGLVVSPADGRICAINEVEPEEDLGLGSEPRIRVSIFLDIFDVHINRAPTSGKISYINYRPGKFFNADLDKASVDNERNALAITMEGDHPYAGQRMGVVQIAGLIARRIVCTVKEENHIKAGEQFGIIRFGSRTDIYLPKGVEPLVCLNQRMIGGETIIADLKSDEEKREGEVR